MKTANLKIYLSLLLFAVLAGMLNFNQSASAATDTWQGNASALFSGLNWTGGNNPPSSGDALVFGAAGTAGAALTADQTAGISYGGITFNSGASAYTIGGANGITLTGNVANNGTSLETLNFPIAAAAVRTFTTTTGGGDLTLGGAFTGTGGGITKTGSGNLNLSGVNSFTSTFIANGGQVNITANSTTSSAGFNNIGATASATGIATVSSGATLTWSGANGGNFGGATSASGALYNSGTYSVSGTTANNCGVYLPNAGSAYGYIYSPGSTTVAGRLWMAEGSGAVGMLDIPGGTVTVGGANDTFNQVLYLNNNGTAGGAGINITAGGTLAVSLSGMQTVINNAAGDYTSVNITGTGSKMTLVGGSGFNLNNLNNAGSTNIFTVASGGELDCAYTYNNNAAAVNTFFNFNGGTAKATATDGNGLFINNTTIYIYSGGATINDNGFSPKVGVPLLAPTGNGVTSIALGGTTNGYIGAPLVEISGGGGGGAAAIANFNPSSGTITNITVTSPGSGYTSAPTVTLVGGNGGSTGSGIGTATATASIGAVSSGGLTKTGAGTVILKAANTYTGNTVISAGTLSLQNSGSLSSGNIIVSNNATFDVSSISFTLGGSQNLKGSGTNNGSINTTSGSGIYADAGVVYGTNTFNNNLTLVSGATAYFNLGTVYNGSNDLINVTSSLVDNGSVQVSAPSTSVNLDTNQDYVLMTSAGLSGSISPTPLWGVKPLNWQNFTVVQNGNNIQLHYTASTPPVASGSASPATVTRNQSALVSVTVTPGSGTVDPNYGVSLNESSLGLSSVYLVLSGTPNVYTNTITIPATVAAGNYTLNALVTDSTPLTGAANISLTVVATNQVWNGAGSDFYTDDNTNWVSGVAPGYVGDAMTFAGNVNTSPDMDQNYTVTGVTFNTNAGSFTISTAEYATVTLTNGSGIVNNSTNAQTLNVPVALSAAQTVNAAAGDLAISGSISGNGALTKTGNNALTFSANNTLGGILNVNKGTLAITNGTTTLNNGGNPNFFICTTNATATVLVADGATLNSTTANTFLRLGVDAAANAGIGIINIADTSSTVNIGGYGMGFGNFAANGKGAVYNSGTFNNTAGGLYLGNNDNSYGYFLNSGTFTGSGNLFLAHNDVTTVNGANAVLDITAGTVTVSSGNGFKMNDQNRAYSGTSGGAQANITGGVLQLYTDGTTIQLNQGGNNYSSMNITGAGMVTTIGSSGFELAVNSATNTLTTLTLQNGGTLQTTFINKAGAAASGVLSFNNGTLVAAQADATALIRSNVTAYIQAGGATIDDNGNNPTVAAALLAPAGNGVTGIALGGTVNGYIGAPVVEITGGGGFGAAAMATFNSTNGMITGIVVTSPGSGYTSAPTVTLAGGNGSATATASIGAVTSGGLTKVGYGTVTLSGANTYTGNTTISNGTLAVSGSGSISSTNIIVTSGAIFDASASSFTLSSGQNVQGNGAVNGLTAAAGSAIFPGSDGTVGTLSFNSGGLTLASGATVNFDLDTTYNGANDQIAGYGTLTLNGNSIHIKAPSALVNLDTTADYVLITAGSISGSFSSTPVWDVKPLNWANYTVVTSGSQVLLHYSTLTPPTGSGFATPSTAVHNQNVLISVTETNGSGTVDSNTGVVLNASTIGGPSSVNLVLSSTISSTVHVYTNTITVPSSAAAGSYTLTAQITDSNSQIGTANISFAVSATEVWNGGGTDQNWSTNPNWVSGAAPDLTGNNLVFAGTAGTSPNMDNSYSVTGLTFSNNAASFTIGSTTSSTLTLTANGIVNNSANAQTLNVPITMSAPQTFNAAAGNIAVSGAVGEASSGLSLTKTGNNALVLSGTNTYTGTTTIAAGSLTLGGAGQLNAGAYAAAIVDNGTLAYNSSAEQVLSGIISGTGALTQSAGVLVLDNVTNTFSGNITVGGYLLATNDVYSAVDNATQGVLGNPAVTNRTITVNNGGTLVFGIGNVFGGGGSTNTPAVSLIINQGGAVQTAATTNVNGLFPGNGGGDANIFGNIILNGGTFSTGNGYANSPDYQAAILLGSVTVGGSSTSTINSIASNANANGLMLGKQGGGTVTFNVASTGAGGADLIVTAPLVNAPNDTTGALLEMGSGTMQLDAANTYAGSTTVSNGTLVGIGSIAGPVVVAPAGTIGAGDASAVGTLTINNNLTLQGNAKLRISKTGGTLTSDLITGISTATYGGSLVVSNITSDTNMLAVGDTFTLFSAGTHSGNFTSIVGSPGTGLLYSFTNGVLSVVASMASNPTNITFNVSGGSVSLSWPATHLGWMVQSNSVDLAVPADWYDISNTASGTSYGITVDASKLNVFYRLRKP